MTDGPPIQSKVGLDTSEFKVAITDMNRQMRLLEGEFRAAAAAMGDWETDSAGLEARMKSLTGQIEVQQKKIAAMRDEYDRVATEKGATSKAAEELYLKILKETEALNKNQRELEQTKDKLNEMGDSSENAATDVDELGKESGDTSLKLEDLKTVAAGVVGAITAVVATVAAMTAAVVGAGKAIADFVIDAAESAGELADLSAKTGVTTTRLQELTYAGQQMGVETETMTGSLTRLIRAMGEAQTNAKGDTAQAFSKLGVQIVDANGNLRDSNEIWEETIGALGNVANETERDVMAMQLMGKSAMELNPIIKAGAQEINNLSQEAHTAGAVVDDETIGALDRLDDSLAGLKQGFEGIKMGIAAIFLGGDAEKVSEYISNMINKIVEAVTQNGPQMLENGMKILTVLSDAVSQIAGGSEAYGKLEEAARKMGKWIGEHLPEIIKAVAKIIWEVNGILVSMGIEMVIGIFQGMSDRKKNEEQSKSISELLVERIKSALNALNEKLIEIGVNIVNGLWQGIQNAKADFEAKIKGFFEGIINAAKEALGIHSPSAMFAAIGENAGMSYVDSLGAALAEGTAALQTAFGDTALALNVSGAGAGGGNSTVVNRNVTINLAANYPQQSPATLAADVRLLGMLYGF